ncbi:MAG: hypothetical protein ACXVJD_02865 [Mucilaginibacter sp.]
MKNISLIILLLFYSIQGISQTKATRPDSEYDKVKASVINFLNWYKNKELDTAKKDGSPFHYSIIRGGYPDTSKQRIDMEGVEEYLNHLKGSGYLSNTYLNDLRQYFKEIGDHMQAAPKVNALVAVPGLNTDWILKTFEPEMILDHIRQGRFDKINIIYNKAIVRFRISKIVQMLFTLTRINDRWVIDYIGYDGTYKYSISRE